MTTSGGRIRRGIGGTEEELDMSLYQCLFPRHAKMESLAQDVDQDNGQSAHGLTPRECHITTPNPQPISVG